MASSQYCSFNEYTLFPRVNIISSPIYVARFKKIWSVTCFCSQVVFAAITAVTSLRERRCADAETIVPTRAVTRALIGHSLIDPFLRAIPSITHADFGQFSTFR